MDFSSFVTSLATSFVIFVVLMLLFVWLSRMPGNKVVYYPSRIIKGMDAWDGKRTRNPFAWIGEALKAKEEDVVAMAGVDTAVYLVFLSSALGILVLSGFLLLPLLLPLAATDKNVKLAKAEKNSNGTFSELDNLAMGNIRKQSPRLWGFLAAAYWVSFVTYYILWKAYKHVSQLRAAALSAPDPKPEQFTVLVRDIPPPSNGQTRKEQVDSYFRSLHPDTFYRSLIITDNKEVNKIWEELENYKKKLARAEVIYEGSKTSSNPEGTRPMNRTGFLGLIGKKVDTIDDCNNKIKELIPKLDAEQKKTVSEKQSSAALVFFNRKQAAISAGQTLHARLVDTWKVTEAPEPRQLLWLNLPITLYQRKIRSIVIYFFVFLMVVFYMIPIGFISAVTTLANLRKLLPFLKAIVDTPAIKTVLEAYLPQIALIVFLALLPAFLMFLSNKEGIPSQSHVVRATSGKYFYFIVFNVFIGVTIGGTLFSSLKTVEKDPNQIIPMLGRNLPPNAIFFLTFVALKFFVGFGLELSRVVPLVIYHIKRKYLCKTDDELRAAWAPGDLGFGTRVPNDVLILTVVLCYSVIAPLIIPFGVAYFGLGWLILRNQALKVYIPSYESYGRMWPHMHLRILAALFLFQLTMIGYFSVKEFYYTPVLVFLPIISLVFAYVCSNCFYRSFDVTPLEVVAQSVKEVPNMEPIFAAYVPPCLSYDKFDDADQYEDARSQMPSRAGSFA
ncbi:hypothetical protein H6P81_019571 [Aristolochia fimbriata]|uniref:CSC1-like protein ERD4 n=1 Tax=Aristolochia fimbriata TaxID=158543 RepID=A0AAV7DV68_ARIFI|nr:hypothetical protein H6P81_019571 [Aristolochia fimbriata]